MNIIKTLLTKGYNIHTLMALSLIMVTPWAYIFGMEWWLGMLPYHVTYTDIGLVEVVEPWLYVSFAPMVYVTLRIVQMSRIRAQRINGTPEDQIRWF